MSLLIDKLAQYAAYHRDPRNIATHCVGIPLIVVAVMTLLSRPAFEVAGLPLSVAAVLFAATSAYYLRLDLRLGLTMLLLHGAALAAGQQLAAQDTASWLVCGLGLFVVGWILQFAGHAWEGRKPAFVDDLVGLVIGPLFVVAEAAFAAGLRHPLRSAIESRAGPVRRRRAGEVTPNVANDGSRARSHTS